MDHSEEAERLIVKRGPGRPPGRPNHSVERVEPREAVREPTRLRRRVRATDDKFAVPVEFQPDGWSWEFKRYLVGGKEDNVYQSELSMNYWEAVTAESHPEVGARYGIKAGPIFIGDMLLMQRPSYLTDDANEEIYDMTISRRQSLKSSLTDAPHGHFSRDHDKTRPKIQKTYERVSSDDIE